MRKLFLPIIAFVLALSTFSVPVMADDGSNQGVKTNILHTCGEEEDGIACVLNLVVDIMSIGVGILAAIGIAIAGIQYLTAGGSEEKVRTSKRRISEIVIGVAIYVAVYAILKWLLPSFGS